MTTFEYDPAKSRANREKHGIDFAEAVSLWGDSGGSKSLSTRRTSPVFSSSAGSGETLDGCVNKQGERVRIISVRRSRKIEVSLYEEHNGEGI
jgi:uncharacterized DUF497 family protein